MSRADEVIDDFRKAMEKSAKRSYKDCNGCEYNRTVKDQIGWEFRGCFGGNYQGKPIAEIELCPLKVESLEKEKPLTEEDLAYKKQVYAQLNNPPKIPSETPAGIKDDGVEYIRKDALLDKLNSALYRAEHLPALLPEMVAAKAATITTIKNCIEINNEL